MEICAAVWGSGEGSGGFVTGLGRFQASWELWGSGRGYVLEVSVPEGTEGAVVLPALSGRGKGRVVWNGRHYGHLGEGRGMEVGCGGGKHKVFVERM